MRLAAGFLKRIWLKPGATLKEIVENDPEYGVFVITSLTGIVAASLQLLPKVLEQDATFPLYWLLPGLIIGGAAGQFIVLYMTGWLLTWIGARLRGVAESCEVRAVIAWSNIPVLVGYLLAWPVLLIIELFLDGGIEWPLSALMFLMQGWGYFILLAGLATVHQFTIWRSTVSLLLMAVVIGASVAVVTGSIKPILKWILPEL